MKCRIQMHVSCRLREQDQQRFYLPPVVGSAFIVKSVQSVCSSLETCGVSGLGQISREHVVVVVTLANQKAVGRSEALTLKKHQVATLAKGKGK